MPDHPIFSRRGFVTTGLAAATTFKLQLAARAAGLGGEAAVCRPIAEQEVGPYYIADELLRSDIAEGKPGAPLSLRIVVLDARTCQPLAHAAVDLWHCDALGLYSGFTKQNAMGPGGPPPGNREGPPGIERGRPAEHHPSDQLTFLRGIQVTGDDGAVDFRTIFPGVYMGRTNHIHFKVRVGGRAAGQSYQAGHTSHVGQIFFPEELAAKLMAEEPYRRHQIHRTTQAEDQIYGGQQGELPVARIEIQGRSRTAGTTVPAALHAELIAAVDPTATPAEARRGR
ncbi:MAG TPA: intradiol ring-cleavage dioxygenase [Bryobacteraceae bacterium]|nr:intradiol ring-cleavage dioxygenase [Bryobacteraceae bacterium]